MQKSVNFTQRLIFSILPGEHHITNMCKADKFYIVSLHYSDNTIALARITKKKNKKKHVETHGILLHGLIYKSNKHVQDNAGVVLSTFST